MDRRMLTEYLERIGAIAEKYDCIARSRIGDTATLAEIRLVEDRIGRQLTPSHRSFLEYANGMSIEIIERSELEDEFPIGVYHFSLWNTSQLIEKFERMGEYFGGHDVGNLTQAAIKALTARYLNVAEFEAEDNFTLMDFSRCATDGEAPIIYVPEVDDTWVGRTIDPVAKSFGEFAERCLSHMIETESDFRFWMPPGRFDWWNASG